MTPDFRVFPRTAYITVYEEQFYWTATQRYWCYSSKYVFYNSAQNPCWNSVKQCKIADSRPATLLNLDYFTYIL